MDDVQPGCRAEDVRTLAGGDMSVERWREGTPPGIGTMHGGNRDTKKGKQDREASGEVGTTGVQGEGETGDHPARGEKGEGEMMITLEKKSHET